MRINSHDANAHQTVDIQLARADAAVQAAGQVKRNLKVFVDAAKYVSGVKDTEATEDTDGCVLVYNKNKNR